MQYYTHYCKDFYSFFFFINFWLKKTFTLYISMYTYKELLRISSDADQMLY